VARILLLTQPTDGGVFQHVAKLAAGLAEAGHELVIAGPFEEPDGVPAARLERVAMVRAVSAAADARAVLAVARLVRRLRPALVHAHSSKAGAVARLARPAFPRTPLVYTPHGYAFAGWFEREAERRRYRLMERALAPLATRVLCVCEAERRLAAQVGPAARTDVVHNGIEPPAPAPVHPAVAEAAGPVIGAVTLLRPGKGIETLIDAIPAVRAEHPAAVVAIAGRGPDRAALEARARARGVEEAVRFLGETAGPMPLLGGADLFVSASWAESFPYNVLEAMAARLPIVATDVGGTAEAIEDGVSGHLVPPRDAGALAEAISALLADRERGARLGEAAGARVTERFDVNQMVAGTLGVYQRARGLP
jgi:glycosyltransferase involved in cell wall biosynthesis